MLKWSVKKWTLHFSASFKTFWNVSPRTLVSCSFFSLCPHIQPLHLRKAKFLVPLAGNKWRHPQCSTIFPPGWSQSVQFLFSLFPFTSAMMVTVVQERRKHPFVMVPRMLQEAPLCCSNLHEPILMQIPSEHQRICSIFQMMLLVLYRKSYGVFKDILLAKR